MPFKVWTAGEEVLASDFNPYVQEQVVATFATQAARDAAILTPRVGQTVFCADVASLMWYTGSAWLGLPRGHLGTTQMPASDNGPGANVVRASVNFSLPATRRCRVDGVAGWSVVTAAITGTCSVAVGFDGATTIRMAALINPAVGASAWGSGYVIANLAAGAHTADLTVLNAGTGGTMRFAAGNGSVSVTDIGT